MSFLCVTMLQPRFHDFSEYDICHCWSEQATILAHFSFLVFIPSCLVAVMCFVLCIISGFDVVCFEQEDDIGGLWRFTTSDTHSSVCKSTVINTSKEMMSYSDFPAPKEFPVFMPNTKVMEYFQMYAKRFDLLKHIKFNTLVKSVKRTDDHDLTGKWEITYYPHGKEIVGQKSEIVDFLFVCTGHHWMKNVPKFEGIDNFKGNVIHSKQYKDFKGFENKNVLVVGRKTFLLFH